MTQSSTRRPLLGVDLDNVLSASEVSMMLALERVTGRELTALAASSYEALAAGLITREEVLETLAGGLSLRRRAGRSGGGAWSVGGGG